MPLRATSGIGYLRFKRDDLIWRMPGRSTVEYHPETVTWIRRATAAGGTFGTQSKAIADALIRRINGAAYNDKLIYLLPFLGGNLATARVPLRDALAVGIATSSGFADSDYSETTGLQGNGTSKYLNSLVYPSQLGTTDNGGLGWWENNLNTAGNVQPMGCYGSSTLNRYVLDLRAASSGFWWGLNTGVPGAGAAINAHYYGQRSSATLRQIYRNGSLGGTSTTSLSPSDASQNQIRIVGALESNGIGSTSEAPWPGRGACAYLTDGTLTAAEASSLHQTLYQYLIQATGRPG